MTYWLIVLIIGVFAAAILSRRRSSRPLRPPRIPPLQPGESYDTSVKLATVPNASLADLWCQRLGEQGIEAFYKPTPYLTSFYGGALVNPGLPQEIWVGEHSVERARQLFPELG
jgi:hypothetical protein